MAASVNIGIREIGQDGEPDTVNIAIGRHAHVADMAIKVPALPGHTQVQALRKALEPYTQELRCAQAIEKGEIVPRIDDRRRNIFFTPLHVAVEIQIACNSPDGISETPAWEDD